MASPKKKKDSKKLYVIRKYIYADSAAQALKKERKAKVDDCWLDEDYKRAKVTELPQAIGFDTEPEYE